MQAKLIYKAEETSLPNRIPACYFGMPDNRIYVVWSKRYNRPNGGYAFKIVIEILEDYKFDYKEEKLYQLFSNKPDLYIFTNSLYDQASQSTTKLKVYEDLLFRPSEDDLNEYVERFVSSNK